MSDINWTPDTIKALRARLGLTQAEFGLELYDVEPQSAQVSVSRLESGDMAPSAAVRRTLMRLQQHGVKRVCATCRHYRLGKNTFTGDIEKGCLNDDAPTCGMATSSDFGCILHEIADS